MDRVEKLIIIGSGPAGLTAAIYAARGNLSPLIIVGQVPGGQLMITTDVDDFPGFPEGIQGPELIEKMTAQAKKFGTRFVNEEVVKVDFKKRPFEITTESQTFKTLSVIIASGASAKWLGHPSEQKFIGKGVSACAVCDGAFFKGKKVIVVGGGDTAMREAQHLSKYASEVTIIHRRDQFRAQCALLDLVKSKLNVRFLMESEIEEVLGDEKVTGVKIKNVKTGDVYEISIDGIFVAIGHQPSTNFLKEQIDLDEKGYAVVTNETMTYISGVFVAGDVADSRYRQAVSAAGSGCKAALDVEEYLEKLRLPTNSH